MTKLQLGAHVIYKTTTGEEAVGVIHAIKKVDTKSGSKIVGYLVDTGNDNRIDEIVTEDETPNILVRQPEQIEVGINDIRAKE